MVDLGTLGGSFSVGSGINVAGDVSGQSDTTGDTAFLAFLYDGTMHDLGTLGGTKSSAADINDADHVVGYSYVSGDATYHAFLYDGTMHDLGTLGRNKQLSSRDQQQWENLGCVVYSIKCRSACVPL